MYNENLSKNKANHSALSPVGFVARAALAHPKRTSIIYGERRYTWKETYDRTLKLASALTKAGIKEGDTVSTLLPNIPEMLELHFAVPMIGAVINTQNTRLDAATVAYMLDHAKTKYFFVDQEYSVLAKQALALCEVMPTVIEVEDCNVSNPESFGNLNYNEFIEQGDSGFAWTSVEDEWQAISLNYTSGTTGNPKGVVYHHRGAYLNSLSNIVGLSLTSSVVYLWTLPMFHCNGWCYTWAVTALAGTHVCLRQPEGRYIYHALANYGVTHMCAAPIILNMLINTEEKYRLPFTQKVITAVGGAAPPSATIAAMDEMGVQVIHLYGLTETFGPTLICDFQDEWANLPLKEKSQKVARQGIPMHSMSAMKVVDMETSQQVPQDGNTIGELLVQGSSVMKGYLLDDGNTLEALKDGWFHTGDLAVWHIDGYVEIKDRAKDIIITGGENVSTLEVESALYQHSGVLEAVVVAGPDEHWGEIVCAFITLKNGEEYTHNCIIDHCRTLLARYKCPKRIVFMDFIPKTSTGKFQKFILRDMLLSEYKVAL